MMIVTPEFLLQSDNLVFFAFHQQIKHRIGCKNVLFFLPLAVLFSSETVRSDIDRFLIKVIHDILYCNICRQVPESLITFFFYFAIPEMTKQTMKQFMQIHTIDPYFVLYKCIQKPCRRSKKQFPVSSHNICLTRNSRTQCPECTLEKTHGNSHLISGVFQNVLADFQSFFFFFSLFVNKISKFAPVLFFHSSNAFLCFLPCFCSSFIKMLTHLESFALCAVSSIFSVSARSGASFLRIRCMESYAFCSPRSLIACCMCSFIYIRYFSFASSVMLTG